MNIKKLIVEFFTVFAIALVIAALVTLLWNVIMHAESKIDWEISFLFAILLGVLQTWVRARETNVK